MIFSFYGYTIRSTAPDDLPLLMAWTPPRAGISQEDHAGFWLAQTNGKQTFLVTRDEPIAVFQTEQVKRDQVRLHLQASPLCPPKKLLRAITKLVPLIEQALRLRGATVIFFSSHSLSMAGYMYVHHQYEMVGREQTADGWVMAKRLGPLARGA